MGDTGHEMLHGESTASLYTGNNSQEIIMKNISCAPPPKILKHIARKTCKRVCAP